MKNGGISRLKQLPNAAAHLHQFTVVVLPWLAFVVKNHGHAGLLVVGFPLGQPLDIGKKSDMLTLNTPGVFISPPLKGRGWGGVCNLLIFN